MVSLGLPLAAAFGLAACSAHVYRDDGPRYSSGGEYRVYATVPTDYVGEVYFYDGRYYSGGRYESGRYSYKGRTYSSRYYHSGRYYYGGNYQHHRSPGSNQGHRGDGSRSRH